MALAASGGLECSAVLSLVASFSLEASFSLVTSLSLEGTYVGSKVALMTPASAGRAALRALEAMVA